MGRAAHGEPARFYRAALDHPSSEGCLLWPYATNVRWGYPQMRVGARVEYVHRLVLEATAGPAPSAGMHAAHSCHRPACVSPWHLRWATPAENAADMTAAGRARVGSRVWCAVLDEPTVAEIRRLLAAGEPTQADIAARFGVGCTAISNIHTGRRWRHVDSEAG